MCLLLLVPGGVLGGSRHKQKPSKIEAAFERTQHFDKVHLLLREAREYIERNATVMATVHLLKSDINHFVESLRDWHISKNPDDKYVSTDCSFHILRGNEAKATFELLDERLAGLMEDAWPKKDAGKTPIWILRIPATDAGWCDMITVAMVATTAPYALVVDSDLRHPDGMLPPN